ncbi:MULTISPECIES: ABC transporter ATP-binding protein [Eubacteriales]|uniref:ABC transporter ATP-binding protein n=1 Tax=Eubacteriales TaxID=186802 RepID=UPI00136D7B37|nr:MULTISPECIES: ABC transporter ATP-binding protein [unclassified Neglectibacter]NBI18938.1 ABC transporter ATP-binding protein [Neglectibacter sp. 59]NBJ74648.1 ABC transporter ATP-binding protein [Neglectibacter sp. X4]NCE82287.1 ABC transporter ATP-binding protein [Neglectibacter sp. X58]
MKILTAENVSYAYKTKYQTVYALREVSCTFETGKLYAIVGRSGSGKSTLLSMLSGMAMPDQGKIIVQGEELTAKKLPKHRRDNISVIYQAFNLFPQLTVLENVTFPMEIVRRERDGYTEKARTLLESVGIKENQFRKLPAQLSGGEQQRVAIARSLGSPGKIMLADEPTGNLDTENGKIVLDILKDLSYKKGYCVIIVTHDMDIAAKSDAVYHMQDGRLERG